MQALIETWQINEKMNQFLLRGLREEHLIDGAATRGWNVGQQFAHIHNVRLMWIKAAIPELLSTQTKIEKDTPVTKDLLITALHKSSEAITELLKSGLASGRIKGFKPHPEGFLGYLIAHESHHRAQAILILKLNGHLPDKKILYGLWEWGTK